MTIGLGKGLAALFSETEEAYENANAEENTKDKSGITELPLDLLFANPEQPRKVFDESALSDLAASIREHGVIVPVLVMKQPDGRYMIIAGERRFRASRLAGKTTIPAVVKEYTKEQAEEIALIENLQREDLNPMEAANAMKRLMEEYRLTQEELARKIGKSRPAITNTLRLLNLPDEVAEYLRKGVISSGHARALLPLPPDTQLAFARRIVKEGLSVRKTERMVKEYVTPPTVIKRKKEADAARATVELKNLIERMRQNFRTKVSFIGNEKKGRIYIDYYTRDDLERIVEILDILEGRPPRT